MRQYTSPLQTLFIKGYQLEDTDRVFVTYSDKLRKKVVTVTDCTVTAEEDGTRIDVQLTQEDTGKFCTHEPISVQVNWITSSGKRKATAVANIRCEENLIKEVIE